VTLLRNSKYIAFLLLLVFAVASFAFIGGCGKAQKPAPKQMNNAGSGVADEHQAKPMPARMIIGYYENPWPGTPDTTGSFPSMKSFAKSMTHVAPFWYRATKDGTLETKDSQLVLDTATQLGLKIFPLITYKTGALETILTKPDIRTKTIDNIVKIVKEKPYDGVNIDFELVPPKNEKDLTAFMAELYPKLNGLNKTVIISVFPKVDVHEDVQGAYNYAELAKNADFLQVMLYDRHWATSPPGAIAPIDWYEKNLQYAIDQVGPQKVIAGVSAYGYDWPKDGQGETVKYVDAIVLAEKQGVKIEYDEKEQAPHFSYKNHEVWFENTKSTDAKLNIVAKYNPAGIAIWRLGQEQPEIWPVIDQKFHK